MQIISDFFLAVQNLNYRIFIGVLIVSVVVFCIELVLIKNDNHQHIILLLTKIFFYIMAAMYTFFSVQDGLLNEHLSTSIAQSTFAIIVIEIVANILSLIINLKEGVKKMERETREKSIL